MAEPAARHRPDDLERDPLSIGGHEIHGRGHDIRRRRKRFVEIGRPVDPDHPGGEAAGHGRGVLVVAAEDDRAQPEVRVVGPIDRFVDRVHARDTSDRAERLDMADVHLLRDAREHGGRNEVVVVPVAAGEHGRARGHCRLDLREHDDARKGLKGKDGTQKLMILAALDRVVRSVFQLYANTVGLHGYTLPNLDEIAELARPSYGNEVRGGEAHMEVGKLIHFVEDKLNHMTVSVKPFGCMPSSGVSDGVQSLIGSQYPEAIFLPIETTGDGAVNVYSRVQMMLFKARQKSKEEYETALAEMGMTEETFRKRMKGSRRFSRSLWNPSHKVAGTAANFVYAVGR